MAKLKISELESAAALDGTELVPVVQDGETVQTTAQDIADLGGGASYLKYVALLSQSSTDAPVATVLENTLGGTVVWTRGDVGEYSGTLAAAFSANKTAIFAQITRGNRVISTIRADADTITIETTDLSNSPADEILEETSFEIRVYP